MMIVSPSIGIEIDADESRCDRIANVGSHITNVGSRVANVRPCNSKVTDRVAIVTAVLAMRSPTIHNHR